MKYVPKEIKTEVNVSQTHPLLNLAYLSGTVVGVTLGIYLALGLVVDAVVPKLSQDTEVKIGQTLAPMAIAQLGGVALAEDNRIAYLEKLLRSLLPPDQTDYPITVHLVDSPIVNAAALAGGQVFVTTAFLESVESENELTFVLAHELGHLQARDGLKGLGRGLLVLAGATLLNLGGGETSGIVTQTINLKELDYSRTQETAADRLGLQGTIRHYGHGGHSLDFFVRLAAEERDRATISRYFTTHPLTGDRITTLENLAQTQGWSMTGSLTPLPANLACPNFEPCDQ
ncbi:MAG: M48 family metallopeptidase [Jaaginema sp. PMC 1079.18]|nr:M48 family metallopeptidase [Jaaginema sp. PMC 1080.18]MEC4849484.1 M48 family metallopeptidase [Jaaginema sp. PMC 1079.18]MEC4866013.1 M48 family metallopeptidase [Jaaginema sp. PMC 1078.18]